MNEEDLATVISSVVAAAVAHLSTSGQDRRSSSQLRHGPSSSSAIQPAANARGQVNLSGALRSRDEPSSSRREDTCARQTISADLHSQNRLVIMVTTVTI